MPGTADAARAQMERRGARLTQKLYPELVQAKKTQLRPNRLKLKLGPLSPHPGHFYAVRERNLTSMLSLDNRGPIMSVCYPNDLCWELSSPDNSNEHP